MGIFRDLLSRGITDFENSPGPPPGPAHVAETEEGALLERQRQVNAWYLEGRRAFETGSSAVRVVQSLAFSGGTVTGEDVIRLAGYLDAVAAQLVKRR